MEMMVRRYSRETRPWIQFHCDNAAITVNIALAADTLHTGGRLLCVVDGSLRAISRDEGEATVHKSSLLHGVSAMRTGVRYSLIVFYHRRADDVVHAGGVGVDASGLLMRAGREPRDRRALVPSRDGFGSAWLFFAQGPAPARDWAAAREQLAQRGYGIVDGFLGSDAALSLHEAAFRLYATEMGSFEQIDQCLRLQLSSASDTRLPRVAEWTKRVDALLAFLAEHQPELTAAAHRSRVSVTVYPGGGACGQRSIDNPSGRHGRILAFHYFLNPGWMAAEHGGCARLWSADGTTTVAATVPPIVDRLVFFWADKRTPHAVDACERDRLALSMWALDGTCAEGCATRGEDAGEKGRQDLKKKLKDKMKEKKR